MSNKPTPPEIQAIHDDHEEQLARLRAKYEADLEALRNNKPSWVDCEHGTHYYEATNEYDYYEDVDDYGRTRMIEGVWLQCRYCGHRVLD